MLVRMLQGILGKVYPYQHQTDLCLVAFTPLYRRSADLASDVFTLYTPLDFLSSGALVIDKNDKL